MIDLTKEIPFPKDKLQNMINTMIDMGMLLHWSFRDDRIYLVIDLYDYIDELEFRKEWDRKGDILLQKDAISNVKSEEIKNILNQVLNEHECKTDKQIRIEIDYYLMELHDYIQAGNKEMIHKTKSRLKELSKYICKVG